MEKNKKFENAFYAVSIITKNIALTEALENYVMEKISKVDKFTDNILDLTVTLELQKLTNKVSILMKFLHFKIQVHAQTEDMYSAIDKAVEKLLVLIRKYKTKLNDHRVKDKAEIPLKMSFLQRESVEDEINDQISEENLKKEEKLYTINEIIDTDTMPLRMLARDEAAMKFELSGEDFLIFKSEEDLTTKVMFRRKDGKIGLIQIEK